VGKNELFAGLAMWIRVNSLHMYISVYGTHVTATH
jgi:hypothetical protein